MKVKICWMEGRNERCTEADLPSEQNLEFQEELVHTMIRKAYKYSDEPLPPGLTEGEL